MYRIPQHLREVKRRLEVLTYQEWVSRLAVVIGAIGVVVIGAKVEKNGFDFGSKYAWRQKQPLELARFIGSIPYLVQWNGVRSCKCYIPGLTRLFLPF